MTSSSSSVPGFVADELWRDWFKPRLLPLWLLFIYMGLMPDRMVPRWNIAGLLIDSRDVTAIVVALFYLAALMRSALAGYHRRVARRTSHLFSATLAITVYAGLSLCWSEIEGLDKAAMLYALALFAATVIIAQGVVADLSPLGVLRVNVGLLAAFSAITAIYAAESLFGLGIRSAEGATVSPDFGMQQVHGPLYASSTGYFVTLPMIGLLIALLQFTTRHRTHLMVMCSVLILALVGTGSRGAVVTGVLFAVCTVLSEPRFMNKIKTLVLLATVIGGAVAIIFSIAKPDRLTEFTDPSRTRHYEYAAEVVANRGWLANLAGSGYGSHWPWYRLDGFVREKHESLAVATASGTLSAVGEGYHPHSVPLVLGVELGLPGLVYFLAVWCWLVKKHGLARREGVFVVWTSAMLASGVGLFLDLFWLYHPPLYLLWWLHAFSIDRLLRYRIPEQAAQRPEFRRSAPLELVGQ